MGPFGFTPAAVGSQPSPGRPWQFVTPEIDFTAPAADVTFLVSGGRFYFYNFQVVTTAFTSQTIQPTVRAGITGSPQKYKANTLLTLLTANYKREFFQNLLEDDGELSVVVGISTPGAGVNYKGKLIVTGFIV